MTDQPGEEWLSVVKLDDESEAEIIEGFLRSEGIPSQVESRYSHEFPTHVGELAEVEVKVPASHAERASRLIAERRAAALPEGSEPPA